MVTTASRGASMTERRNLRTPDVLDLTEASYRQLDWWCRTYAICADPTPGSGTGRTFTVTEARVARALVLAGLHGLAIAPYVRGIHAALHAQPAAAYLVLEGGRASAHLDATHAATYAIKSAATATIVPLRFAK